MQGLLTLVFVVAGDIATLIDFASFLMWTFYLLAMLALLVMRKTKQDAPRPYKVLARSLDSEEWRLLGCYAVWLL
jgi:L-type amino acid transporter 9